ncbi:hypothetical protein LTR62_003099 [Meristemomyces frigidus]|uniref:SP-RING-type domain-containing protein n=1 Tax=Meristemomyces frigidus TaxID=1508187 RepID=A0AAN7TSE8_9PEZI|nr:hypothetical protein LTR62_003099 [Meristemomyces frigidus]
MASSGPSPKRRRTDNTPVSAASIAQANATMQTIFSGNARQNRWMTGGTSGQLTDPTAPANRGAAPTSRLNENAALRNGNQASLKAAGSTPTLSIKATSTHLVDYQLPNIAPAPARPRNTLGNSGRKSLELQAGALARQGLPSPAPSEENTVNSPLIRTSPLLAPAVLPRRGPDGPHAAIRQGSASSATMSPMLVDHQRPSWAAPQPSHTARSIAGPSSTRPPSRSLRSNVPGDQQKPQVAVTSPMFPSNVPAFARSSPLGQMSAQPAVFVSPAQSPVYPPNPHSRDAASVLPLNHFFDPNVLLGQIAAQIQRLDSLDPSGTNSPNDRPRMILLQDAVLNSDSFYLVLSQLFCLHSRQGGHTELPRSIRGATAESWERLASLLCDNSTLIPSTVQWFSEFPIPVARMEDYSALKPGFKAAYETQVSRVSDFMNKLSQEWMALVRSSMKRSAPPLVEDLCFKLSLYSPILQNTAFRAIARTFWPQYTPSRAEQGIAQLMTLHFQDQQWWLSGLSWAPSKKEDGYAAFKKVYTGWMLYDQASQQYYAQYGPNGPVLAPYQMPRDVLATFGMQYPGAGPTNAQLPLVRQASGSSGRSSQGAQQPRTSMPLSARAQQVQQDWLRQSIVPSMLPQNGLTFVAPSRQNATGIPKVNRALLPPLDECPRAQPTHPDSSRSALHQAHLRSPVLVASQVAGATPKLYRYVTGCALSPQSIDKDVPIQCRTFHLGDNFQSINLAATSGGTRGERLTHTISEASKQYRLRCCKVDKKSGFETLSSWVEADNIWPDNVFFDLNGTSLEPRRKLHHGRYQSIDLTYLVQPGPNVLKIVLIRSADDSSDFNYAIAVETIGAKTHENLLQTIPLVSVEDSLNTIKHSLSSAPNSDNHDNEIQLISSTTTIKLFDPISCSHIFTRPIRGRNCLHRDPCDLETFLSQSQVPRHAAPGDNAPSIVDTWRCPICRRDVRPDMLIEDGFLVEVRRMLEEQGRLDTRAIVVAADGGWRIKAEGKTGVRSASLEREQGATVGVVGGGRVVIELD